jgi:hypothetical protein
MVTKRAHIVSILLLIGIASLQFQCNKGLRCAETVYGFGISIKAYPDNEILKIGDTLWFDINEATTLKDGTGNMVDYSGAVNLGCVVNFDRLSPANQFTEASADRFRFLLNKGQQTQSIDATFAREYLFREENGLYLFQLGIIPKDTGTFRVLFSDAANVYRKQDKCTKATFSLLFKNTDQHYYLSPFYNGDTSLVGRDYYFKVY